MATSYLTSNELSNLDNKIFHCINQLNVWKKGINIDNIYKQIIKINNFKEISKDYALARGRKPKDTEPNYSKPYTEAATGRVL